MGDESDRAAQSDPYLLINRTTSRYALPVKDNIDFTRSIPDLQGTKSELSERQLPTELRRLTNAYYESSGDGFALTSTARCSRHFSIPVHLASSSARGLLDLYFFCNTLLDPTISWSSMSRRVISILTTRY